MKIEPQRINYYVHFYTEAIASIQSSEVGRNVESSGASLTGFTMRRMKGRRISLHCPLFPCFSLPFNVSGSTGYFREMQQWIVTSVARSTWFVATRDTQIMQIQLQFNLWKTAELVIPAFHLLIGPPWKFLWSRCSGRKLKFRSSRAIVDSVK